MLNQMLIEMSNKLNANLSQMQEETANAAKHMYDIKCEQEAIMAKETGDRSENSSFTQAKQTYDNAVTTLTNLQKRKLALDKYVAIKYKTSAIIHIGTTIELKLVQDSSKKDVVVDTVHMINGQRIVEKKRLDKMIMLIVPENVGDAARGYLAIDSEVGKAVLGQPAHSTVTVTTIKGNLTYEIGDIY